MKSHWKLLLLAMVIFSSCVPDEREDTITYGLRPIYATDIEPDHFAMLSPQAVNKLGKIYTKDHLLFVGEQGKGIHIYDNTDPANPKNLHFLELYGNLEIAVKGDILYVDNFNDLVAIDISDLAQPKEVSRVKDVYELGNGMYPANYSGYFECVNRNLGVVIGWEEARLTNPRCLR